MSDALSPVEVRRYARQLRLPEVGRAGQERLKASSVLVVGAGGLGSPLALQLAAAGVGRIGLVDPDRVDESNLHRQLLYGSADVGRLKVEAAAARLRDLNPHLEVVPVAERFAVGNALALVRGFDLVADGTDNFPTRYLVNDACVLAGRPNVFASVQRFEGQLTVFDAGRGPCYRCLFPEPPGEGLVPSCADAGVLGVVPGLLGTLQASEALKLLLGLGEPPVGRLLLIDLLRLRCREVRFTRRAGCAACSPEGRARLVLSDEPGCMTAPCAPCAPAEADTASEPLAFDLPVRDLARWRDERRRFTLLDVRTAEELAVAALPGARHLPLHELPRRLAELPPDEPLVVVCHLGGRSAQAVAFLRARGFPQAVNLDGGIDAWSVEVDPSVPRY